MRKIMNIRLLFIALLLSNKWFFNCNKLIILTISPHKYQFIIWKGANKYKYKSSNRLSILQKLSYYFLICLMMTVRNGRNIALWNKILLCVLILYTLQCGRLWTYGCCSLHLLSNEKPIYSYLKHGKWRNINDYESFQQNIDQN